MNIKTFLGALLLFSAAICTAQQTSLAEAERQTSLAEAERQTSLAEAARQTRFNDSLAALREQAMGSDLAYQLVESLTTEIGPRLAGTPADAKAVTWAQQKFKSLGFDKVYLEPVTYPVWQRGAESLQVLAPYTQTLQVSALGGSIGTSAHGLRAQVVEFADLTALNAADAEQVRGKIVFINKRMERSRDGSSYGPVVAARVTGADAAARKGAVGLLIRSVGTDHHSRAPHTGVMRYQSDNVSADPAAQRVPKIPAAAIGNADADLLAAILKRPLPVKVSLQLAAKTLPKLYTGYNVIGEFTGSELPNQVVAIGAHLDSWDEAPGALDDGAGCAITMAAAHLIKQAGQPKRTVRVVLFANEEQGVYGGKAYAEARKVSGEIAQQVIAAESDFGAGKVYQLDLQLPEAQRSGLEFLYAALAPIGVAVGAFEASGSADFGPMKALGAPVADLQQDGTRYFDVHHTPEDTLDKIKPAELRQNVAAYAVFAAFFANRDLPKNK